MGPWGSHLSHLLSNAYFQHLFLHNKFSLIVNQTVFRIKAEISRIIFGQDLQLFMELKPYVIYSNSMDFRKARASREVGNSGHSEMHMLGQEPGKTGHFHKTNQIKQPENSHSRSCP